MPEIVNPETHHEKSDVNVRALLWATVIFIVFGAVTHLLLYAQFHLYRRIFRGTTNAPLTSVARPPDDAVPPLPRLQPFTSKKPPITSTPVTDMEEMRAAEEKALHNPGWVDKQKGIVRLPIEVAKQLAVQRVAAAASAAGARPGAAAPTQTTGAHP
jgi:hypothetical protein